MAHNPVRYNTDIPTEHRYKYREKPETKEGDFYYGPDSDMLQKTWIASKRGALLGVGIGSVMATYQPTNNLQLRPAIEQMFRHGMPPLIASATFGATLSLAANLRHKEDPLNHFIGGYAAGTMIGAWYKSVKVGFWTGVGFGLVASAFKVMADEGILNRPYTYRRERVFDFYRTGWMIDRPAQDGEDNEKDNNIYKKYNTKL